MFGPDRDERRLKTRLGFRWARRTSPSATVDVFLEAKPARRCSKGATLVKTMLHSLCNQISSSTHSSVV